MTIDFIKKMHSTNYQINKNLENNFLNKINIVWNSYITE